MIYQTPNTYSWQAGLAPSLQLSAAALSQQGQRERNEDTILHHVSQTLKGEPLGIFIVGDGMGGWEAGDLASRMAVRTIGIELAPYLAAASDTKPTRLNERIRQALALANRKIWQYAQDKAETGFRMGTTLTLAIIVGPRLHVAHVGHSRAYLWREGQLKQLTHDHSLASDLARQVHLTQAQRANHPYRNVLTRALGRRPTVEVDQLVQKLYAGDRLLLCTDGLWQGLAQSEEMGQELARPLTPQEQCQHLLRAITSPESDNTSVIVIHCDDPFVPVTSPFHASVMAQNSSSSSLVPALKSTPQDVLHA